MRLNCFIVHNTTREKETKTSENTLKYENKQSLIMTNDAHIHTIVVYGGGATAAGEAKVSLIKTYFNQTTRYR